MDATGEEMNAFETVMWRIESDPALRTPAMACLELDAVPDPERLAAVHTAALGVIPRLGQRVVEPALGLGVPRWTTDPEMDLRFHLRRHQLPAHGGWPELMSSLSQFYMSPLDRARSPWEALLIEGLPRGRALYALKMHHAITDGLGVMQHLTRILSPERQKDLPGEPPPAHLRTPPMSPCEAVLAQARDDLSRVPGEVGKLGSAGLRSLAAPVSTAGAVSRYLSSLGRVLAPPAAESSALLASRGLTLRLAAVDVPFDRFRAAARAAGAA